jgi:hypothetical protein
MSGFQPTDDAAARAIWRRIQRQMWLAQIAASLGALWRGALGLWFFGIGFWWLRSDAVADIYALAVGLQLGLGCPAERISISLDGWVSLERYLPWPVLAFPGELMLVGGLVLMVAAVRRLKR